MTSETFNEVCYIARYPDLQDSSTLPPKPGLPWTEQKGWMYKSSDGTWHYGRTNNRELKKIQDNAYWHWLNFGSKEGRVPGCDLSGTLYSENFDADAYQARYPDVAGKTFTSFGFKNNPLNHWLQIGKSEGRKPGYELVTASTLPGLASAGTTRIVTVSEVAADQAAFDAENKTPGDGLQASESEQAEIIPNKNIILVAGATIVALFLFLKKRK